MVASSSTSHSVSSLRISVGNVPYGFVLGALCKREMNDMGSSAKILEALNSLTNPRQALAAQDYYRINIYNISGDYPMSFTSLLYGVSHIVTSVIF